MNIFITSFYSRIFVLLLIIISSTVIFSNTDVYGETDYEIPEWIKINATWWMNDQLSDDEFVLSIKFLINEKIIVIPQNSIIQNSDLPDWIVHNAGWWHARIFTNSDISNFDSSYINEKILLYSGGLWENIPEDVETPAD